MKSASEAARRVKIPCSWVIDDEDGAKYLLKFMKQERSEESLVFWQQTEEYRRTPHDKMMEKAKEIYAKHIAPDACNAVELTAATIDDITNSIQRQNIPLDLFTVAQEEAFGAMNQDFYFRFVNNSNEYPELVQSLLLRLHRSMKQKLNPEAQQQQQLISSSKQPPQQQANKQQQQQQQQQQASKQPQSAAPASPVDLPLDKMLEAHLSTEDLRANPLLMASCLEQLKSDNLSEHLLLFSECTRFANREMTAAEISKNTKMITVSFMKQITVYFDSERIDKMAAENKKEFFGAIAEAVRIKFDSVYLSNLRKQSAFSFLFSACKSVAEEKQQQSLLSLGRSSIIVPKSSTSYAAPAPVSRPPVDMKDTFFDSQLLNDFIVYCQTENLHPYPSFWRDVHAFKQAPILSGALAISHKYLRKGADLFLTDTTTLVHKASTTNAIEQLSKESSQPDKLLPVFDALQQEVFSFLEKTSIFTRYSKSISFQASIAKRSPQPSPQKQQQQQQQQQQPHPPQSSPRAHEKRCTIL